MRFCKRGHLVKPDPWRRGRYLCLVCRRATWRRWWHRHRDEILERCRRAKQPAPWSLSRYVRAVVTLYRAGGFWQENTKLMRINAEAEAAMEALAKHFENRDGPTRRKRRKDAAARAAADREVRDELTSLVDIRKLRRIPRPCEGS